jgi:hypothetical protein
MRGAHPANGSNASGPGAPFGSAVLDAVTVAPAAAVDEPTVPVAEGRAVAGVVPGVVVHPQFRSCWVGRPSPVCTVTFVSGRSWNRGKWNTWPEVSRRAYPRIWRVCCPRFLIAIQGSVLTLVIRIGLGTCWSESAVALKARGWPESPVEAQAPSPRMIASTPMTALFMSCPG